MRRPLPGRGGERLIRLLIQPKHPRCLPVPNDPGRAHALRQPDRDRHGLHHALELGGARLESGLRPLALRDIAEDDLGCQFAVHQDRGGGGLDGKCRTIQAAIGQARQLRRWRRARAGPRIRISASVRLSIGDQPEHVTADQVIGAVGAEQGRRLPVGQNDAAMAMRDDCIRRGLD